MDAPDRQPPTYSTPRVAAAMFLTGLAALTPWWPALSRRLTGHADRALHPRD